MPAGVSRRQLRHVAFPRPRLLSPSIAVEVRDDIDEFAASYGVVHDMAMRAHPHRAFRNGNVARYSASGRHAAPADTAGESRRVRAEQALPHNRMNAVSADDDVGLDLAAVGKARDRAAITFFHGDAAGSKTEIDRLERAAQHVEQVGAVHCQVRRAELLAERASAHARDDPPTLPAADDQKIRLRPEGDDCVFDAENTERHQRVGTEIEASAYLVQCGRLLADDNFRAPSFQRQRRGKAANAAADDGNAWRAGHASPSICGFRQRRPHALALLRARRERPRSRRAAEQRDEIAALHSITSSARAMSDGGTTRPSPLAVWRLMTRSYLVGACIGKSAGFSPLRLRSTYAAERRTISAVLG